MLWRKNRRKLSIDSLVSGGLQMASEIKQDRTEIESLTTQLTAARTELEGLRAELGELKNHLASFQDRWLHDGQPLNPDWSAWTWSNKAHELISHPRPERPGAMVAVRREDLEALFDENGDLGGVQITTDAVDRLRTAINPQPRQREGKE